MKTIIYRVEGDYISLFDNEVLIDVIPYDDRFELPFQLNFWAVQQETDDTIIFEKQWTKQ